MVRVESSRARGALRPALAISFVTTCLLQGCAIRLRPLPGEDTARESAVDGLAIETNGDAETPDGAVDDADDVSQDTPVLDLIAPDVAAPDVTLSDARDVLVIDVSPPDVTLPDVRDVPVMLDVPPRDVPVMLDVPVDVGPNYRTTMMTARGAYVGSMGTMMLETTCRADEVMVGARVVFDNRPMMNHHVSRISARCARLMPDGTLGAPREAGAIGSGAADDTRFGDCPAGQAVAELNAESGDVVDRVRLRCSTIPVWLGSRSLLGTVGPWPDTGATPNLSTCPPNTIGQGFSGLQLNYFGGNVLGRVAISCVGITGP